MELRESGGASVADMEVHVSKMEESIEVLIQASVKTAKDPDGGPYPVCPSGKSRDETSHKMSSGKKFFHNAIPEADFALC